MNDNTGTTGTNINTKEKQTESQESTASIQTEDLVDEGVNDVFSDESSSQGADFGTFKGWARVFFQGRKDRSATQLLPLNSARQSRDSYLYIEVDIKGKNLHFYPSDDEKILLVKPPINLSHFYAVKVPKSQCGVALFLREDDRYFHRFLFRFEFRNDCVKMPLSQFRIQTQYSNLVHHKKTKDKHSIFTTMSPKHGDRQIENSSQRDQKFYQACHTYIEATNELLKDVSDAANQFIEAVNMDHVIKRQKYRVRSWGTGYRDNATILTDDESSSDDDSEDDSNYSDNSFAQSDFSDEDRKTESIQQSFEKMFGKVTRVLDK